MVAVRVFEINRIASTVMFSFVLPRTFGLMNTVGLQMSQGMFKVISVSHFKGDLLN